MRVIAGKAKGRKLTAPKGNATRPMLDRVKENVFNILAERPVDAVVLDVFAGSGSLGIEALSRGAASVVFVEAAAAACRVIELNVERCGFASQAQVVRGTAPAVFDYLPRTPFDLIFMDPPYRIAVSELVATLEVLAPRLSPDGELVLQTTPELKVPEIAELLAVDERKYGQTVISLLQRRN